MPVRLARPEDAEAIARVHVRTWQGAYRHVFGDALDQLSIEERVRLARDVLAHDDSRTFVGEIEGEIVGFASAGPCRDEDADSGTGELYAIYVLPERWGEGLARALVAAAEADLRRRGYSRATLWVLEDNPRARRFYERSGWELLAGRKDFERFDVVAPVVHYAKRLSG